MLADSPIPREGQQSVVRELNLKGFDYELNASRSSGECGVDGSYHRGRGPDLAVWLPRFRDATTKGQGCARWARQYGRTARRWRELDRDGFYDLFALREYMHVLSRSISL
jgi:hypothetical protein